jgi:hypothetical protein
MEFTRSLPGSQPITSIQNIAQDTGIQWRNFVLYMESFVLQGTECNIKIDLKETSGKVMDLIDMIQHKKKWRALENMSMNL